VYIAALNNSLFGYFKSKCVQKVAQISVVARSAIIQASMWLVRFPIRMSSILLILPAELGPGVYSTSKRKYQKQNKSISGE
jgi:hypothetical protein